MHKKPTAVLEAAGAFVKDPQRRRKAEPQPRKGIGQAPVNPSFDFSAVWDELVDNVCPGVLGNSDRIWMEIAAGLLCQYRQNPPEMSSAKINQLQKALANMGMNPVDRTRIVAQQEEKVDKQDAYF